MKHITVRAQLNRHLYQQERRIVNEVIRRVASAEDRELIRLALLTFINYRGLVHFRTEDPYVAIIVAGLKPYIEQSLRKAEDSNYNAAMPEDLPTDDDKD